MYSVIDTIMLIIGQFEPGFNPYPHSVGIGSGNGHCSLDDRGTEEWGAYQSMAPGGSDQPMTPGGHTEGCCQRSTQVAGGCSGGGQEGGEYDLVISVREVLFLYALCACISSSGERLYFIRGLRVSVWYKL